MDMVSLTVSDLTPIQFQLPNFTALNISANFSEDSHCTPALMLKLLDKVRPDAQAIAVG